MKSLVLMTVLLSLAGGAQAHVAELPLPQHALEHAWIVPVLLPLLWLLASSRRGHR